MQGRSLLDYDLGIIFTETSQKVRLPTDLVAYSIMVIIHTVYTNNCRYRIVAHSTTAHTSHECHLLLYEYAYIALKCQKTFVFGDSNKYILIKSGCDIRMDRQTGRQTDRQT